MGWRFDGDSHAEFLDSAKMVTHELLGVEVIEVRVPEFLVRNLVVQHVPAGDDQAVGDRCRGLLHTAPAADALEQRREVGIASAHHPRSASIKAARSQRSPFRVRLERRLPALSEFPGQRPTPPMQRELDRYLRFYDF